ncbi:MAG: hypothetical protein WB510_05885 [Candidatus Sulfotelmatobacter sp.]
MPLASCDRDQLLTQLETAWNNFGPGAAARIARLLIQLSRLQFTDPRHLIRFHEALLFLRAFPQSQALVARVEHLLNTFRRRIEELQSLRAGMSLFDDFDTSGISGTTMQDTLSFDVAQWLVRRIPRNVDIAWDDYWDDFQADRARGNTWPRFIPLLEEDADVEANIPWLSWLDAARGRQHPLEWLLARFEQLPLTARARAELYDSLRLPVRWRLANLKLSRTRNWTRPRHFYFHDAPLLQRSQVSLAQELARPAPRLEKLSPRDGKSVMHAIREVMLVRYRELYGTTLGDPRSVVCADLGRGVVIHLWNLPPGRRLPLRAYVAGFTLKNGVPINYIEAIGLCEWIEVGFNTFYTYRQGETAWIYAQALRCLHALTGATTISIYPYQIGQNNDEAIDSGAFWFYRKLGFRPGRADLQKLCEREEVKIAANPQYRTPKKTLKRLAEAYMFYEWDRPTTPSGAASVAHENPASPAHGQPGPWDTFSTRNLALRVNRRMAREFNGESQPIRRASLAAIIRALNLNPTRWTPSEKSALENWSLVLALIPDLHRWSPQEKRDAVNLIRAQAGRNEMRYLRLTQQHARLRQEVLRLGSKP